MQLKQTPPFQKPEGKLQLDLLLVSAVHSNPAKVEELATASIIVEMVRANKMGMDVIDASMAMQGQGPDIQ